METHW